MKKFVLCEDETQTYHSMWDIGATGAHTKTANVPGRGVASIARTAAGMYTITFNFGVPVGGLVDLEVTHWPAASAEPRSCRPTVSSYTTETAAAAATAKYEAWSLTTPAKTELANGDKVSIRATFLKTR